MFPSEEQRSILGSQHRLTVVHAVPGSGKTSVFVHFFLSKADLLKGSKKKIAALSFTTSASKEIESRSKGALNNHFVGTIDSFLLKNILKPFGVLFGLPASGVSIIPSPLDEEMKARAVRVGPEVRDTISIFKLKFSGGTIEEPTLTYSKNYQQVVVPPAYVPGILREKMREWQERGRFTHSDCQYFVAKMLSDTQVAPVMLTILSAKFPWILVDEFQDTGNFLYISLKIILSHPSFSGLVVGDPDQAIFEFSGANPNNFADLMAIAGVVELPMTTTRRCPTVICNFASLFTNLGTRINPASTEVQGRIRICVYNRDPILNEHLIGILSADLDGMGKTLVVSRKNKDVRSLFGHTPIQGYEIKSLAPRSIHDGIFLFRNGKCKDAFKILSRTISSLVWNEEVVTSSDRPTLDWLEWKRKIYRLMVCLDTAVPGESWNHWVARAKVNVEAIAASYGVNVLLAGSFRNDRTNGNALKAITQAHAVIANNLQDFKLKNIHEAKGTEADTVIWYIPKQTIKNCLFNSCFGTTLNLEEMRIAFVAITRAKRNLVVLMHQDSLARLQVHRPLLIGNAQITNI